MVNCELDSLEGVSLAAYSAAWMVVSTAESTVVLSADK